VANVDFDDQALNALGFGTDIYYMLGHLGWVQFSNGVSANTHKEFALEILMTMAPIFDEGVQSLSFRLEGIQQVVPYEYIRELLGFKKGAPKKVDVLDGMLDGFWNLISGEAHQQHNSIRNPIIQVFHYWMFKRIMGRMRETKVTDTELNWHYSALIAKQPIDPSYLIINRWCCEATSGLGDIGLGCVNTKNWYRKETDLWAEFGRRVPFGKRFSSKHLVKNVCSREHVIIWQKGCFTLGRGSIRECVMTWLEYKEGTN
jgi:hypothetical protein